MATHLQTIEARATFITLMLREDHQKVRQLFEQFDNTTITEKREIMKETLAVLEVHTKLKQELIYPAWREHVHEQSLDLLDEARETLHVVHALMKALKTMNPEDERYESMCTVLKNQVTHHINEEEGKMFPLAEQTDLDWERLTTHVIQRRQSLEQKPLWLLGVPVIVSTRATAGATRAALSGRSGG
ncbi:MAG TPA: hemerythrin domain-containing protein [Nitrospiraceae bacterium]|nr:hemerythrin domain-containing protein [Nitrospiraceae bacterium]